MRKVRKKSAQDIYDQSYKLLTEIATRAYNKASDKQNYLDKQSEARLDKVASITRRYKENINRKLNPWASQGVPMENSAFATKVSRSTYMGLSAG